MSTRFSSRPSFLETLRSIVSGRRPTVVASRRHARSLEVLEARIAPAAALGATKIAVFAPGGDLNHDGKFQPGDTILYTVTITNNGDVDLSGVSFNDLIDGNTTLGAVNVSPLALDDTFSAVANTLLEVGVTHGAFPAAQTAGSVTANDVEFLGDTFTLSKLEAVSFSGGTATAASAHGTVTMNANGNFTYLPAAGFTGTDTFHYTITDKGLDGIAGNADDLTSVGTVTINVGTQKVWYVDNSYAGANGPSDGRSTTPFTSLATLNLTTGVGHVDGPGDILYVSHGTGAAYTGGIVLEGNQTLHGQGEALTVGGFTLNAAGTAPLLTNVGGTIVALSNAGSNVNAIKGVTLGDSNIDISGSSFGTLNITNTVSLNGTGKALDLTTGTINATLADLTVTSSATQGISLTGVDGALTATSGSFAGITGDDIFISGGAANITLGISDTNTAGHSVDIVSKTSGTVSLSGSINDTGTGLLLSGDNGATFHFTGGIIANTGANKAFSATGGGTIDVTGSGNTLTTTTATALEVTGTTIGGNGLTFLSINKNGGSTNAITLDSTGGGFLTVTGSGTTAASGGTLQNISGVDAVHLNNTGGLITFKNMVIQDITSPGDAGAVNDTHSNVDAIQGTQILGGLTIDHTTIQRISDSGINGSVDNAGSPQSPTATVWNGLTITNSTIQDTNRFNVSGHADAQSEGAVFMLGLKGTVLVTGDTIQRAGSGLDINTDTSGILDMTVQSNTFTTLYKEPGGTASVGNWGINVVQLGSLSSTIRIGDTATESNPALGNTFTDAGRLAGIRIVGENTSTGPLKVSVAKNTFTVTDHSTPGVAAGGTNYNFPQGGVMYRPRGTGNFEGIFAANVMNQVMHADGGLGQFSMIAEGGDAEIIARNNNFSLPWDAPVELRADGFSGTQSSAKVLFSGNTYTSGTVGDGTTDLGGPSPYEGFYASMRNGGHLDLTIQNETLPLTDNTSTLNSSLTVQATGNTAGSPAGGVVNVFLQNVQAFRGFKFSEAAPLTMNVYKGVSSSGTLQTVLQDNGDRGGGGVATTNPPTVSASGTINIVATAPALPSITAPLMFAPSAGDAAVVPAQPGSSGTPSTGGSGTTAAAPSTGSIIVDDGVLSQAELDSLVGAAIARWEATGLTPAQDAVLHSVTFSVQDLPGWYLGEATPGHVILDLNAAGNSWFIDPTPNDDSEFAGSHATATGGAAGRIDALTTVMHELGHQLGLDDTYASADSGNLMYGYIHQSERRLPAAHQADGADPNHLAEISGPDFAIGPINIGSLPAGKSVQVVFNATINANDTANTISNQGTASSTQTGSVQTDGDPVTPGQQPTITQVAFPEVNLAIGSTTSVAEDSGGNLVYTFTRQGPTTSALTVNFNVSGGAVFTGNAASDTDYTETGADSFSASTGTVTFAQGSSTAVVTVTPHADTVTEPDETVILTLASGTAYQVAASGSTSGTGTIVNDDTTVSVTGSPGSVGEDSGSTLTYTFKRAGVIASALDVHVHLSGSATFTSDYTESGATSAYDGTDATLHFAAGSDTAIITLTPVADNTVETDETVQMDIVAGTGYTVDGTLHTLTGTISNDDSMVKTELLGATTVVEDSGGHIDYTFTRTGYLGNALAVSYQASGTATGYGPGATDYTVSGGGAGSSFSGGPAGTGAGTLVFAAGSATATLSVSPVADTTVEPNETVTITLNANGTPATTGGYSLDTPSSATGTILDDDTSLHATLDGSGNLTIADVSATGRDNALTFHLVNGGHDLQITDPVEVFDGAPTTSPASAVSNSGHTLTIPFSAVTGSLTINTAGGNDTVTLDLSGGNFIHAGGVFYNGGNPTTAPGDKLIISGGAEGTVTYNHLNAHDGNVIMSNFGTVNFTGLEPIINSGTATDVIFNLPGTDDIATLGDNGATPGDGLLRLSSSPVTFEQTDFAIPSNSLTINLGAGSDTLTVGQTPQFTAGLNIHGGTGDDTINLNGGINFDAGQHLNVDLQNDDPNPGIDTITIGGTANYVLSGAGHAILTASKSILVNSGGHLATQDGALTLAANQQATSTSGNFKGVSVSGTIESTGTGIVTVLGKGGDDPAGNQVGVIVLGGGLIRGGSTGDSTLVTGYGGISVGTANSGVQVAGGTIQSVGGNIDIIGVGGGTGGASSGNGGIGILNSGQVLGGTNGNVILDGARGVGTGNAIALAATGATVSSSGTGNITIIGDTIRIDTSGTTINAGANLVSLHQKTDGTPIDIGSPAGPNNNLVELSNAELNRITAGTVQVGDSHSGAINITAVISPLNYNTLSIGHAAAFTSSGGFVSDVTSGTVYEKMLVAGALSIDPAATLTVNSATYVPTASDSFTIINNTSAGTTTGAFSGKPEGATVPVGGFNERITYVGGTGNDVVLQNTAVSVGVDAGSISEAANGGAHLTYTFTRTGDLSTALTVNFGASGSASYTAAGNDYLIVGADAFNVNTGVGTLTFAAGSSTATFSLYPTNDTLVEGDEQAVFSVTSGTGYGISGTPASATIIDNDTGTVSFVMASSNAPEQTTPHLVDVHLVLFSPEGPASLQNDFTVYVQDHGGSGASPATGGGVDYTFNEQPLTFSAGDTGSTKTASVGIVNDTISEGNEMFQLGLSATSGMAPVGAASPVTVDSGLHTVTIIDNDVDVHVTASGTLGSVLAGSGANNFQVVFSVQNTGLVDATNLSLSELFTLPTGVTFSNAIGNAGDTIVLDSTGGTWTIPTLVQGGFDQLTVNFTADHSTPSGASASVTSTASSADQTLVNTGDDSAMQGGSFSRQSDLHLTKTASPDPVGPGGELTYTITVHNNGPSDATSASVTDLLPTAYYANATWTTKLNGVPGPADAGDVNVSSAIPAQGDFVITVVGTVTAASNTSFSNTASVNSSEETNFMDNQDTATTFVGGVDLTLHKTADHDTRNPGDVIKYTLSYHNGGFITANGVNINDIIPANTTFDLADSTAGWQDSGGNTLADGAAAGTMVKLPVGSVAVGMTDASVVLAVKVKPTVAAGADTIDNTASIADDGNNGADLNPGDNNASVHTTLVAAPDLHLTETADKLLIIRGQTLHVTYSYSNDGNQDASGTTIVAHVPTGTTFDPFQSSVGWSDSGMGNFTLDLGTVAATSSNTVIFAVDLNTTRVANLHEVDTTATIADDGNNGSDPTPANNTVTNAAALTKIYEGIYVVSQGIAVAGKFGTPTVHVYDPVDGHQLYQFDAYESKLRASVRVAVADINGDGFDDIITTIGTGTGRLRVFDGLTGTWLHDEASYTGPFKNEIAVFNGKTDKGAFVAAGDLTGDGHADIVVGSALGGGKVRVLDGATGVAADVRPVEHGLLPAVRQDVQGRRPRSGRGCARQQPRRPRGCHGLLRLRGEGLRRQRLRRVQVPRRGGSAAAGGPGRDPRLQGRAGELQRRPLHCARRPRRRRQARPHHRPQLAQADAGGELQRPAQG